MLTAAPPSTERPFDDAELRQRVATTRARMSELGVDLLVFSDQDDMYYLTGARDLGGLMLAVLLLAREGDPVFVGRAVDALAFAAYTGTSASAGYRDGDVPEERIAATIAALVAPAAVIGVQPGSASLPVSALNHLKRSLPRVTWEDCTRIVWDQRVCKSPRELEHLRAAAQINTTALDRALRAVRPGATESLISAELFAGLLEGGSHPMASYILTSGLNTRVVHATYGARAIEPGDHVHFEFSAARFRYHAPLMRTSQLGEPSPKVRQLHDAAQAALEAALGAIRAGVTSGEVDAAANAALEELGARQWHHHRTGYSMGIATGSFWPEGHILALREGDPTVLEENMTFHLPMVLFEPGVAGAGCSETVRVTADGVEVLTSYPRELIRL